MKTSFLATVSVYIVLTVCSVSSWAGRGTKDGGGGDAILCGQQAYLADTFEVLYKSSLGSSGPSAQYALLNQISRPQIKNLMIQVLVAKDPGTAIKILNIQKNILKFHQVDEKLAELDDDNIKIKDFFARMRCHKIQLAIQDRSTGRVLIQRGLFNSLSPIEQASLELHEAFIYLYGPSSDTSPLRELVRSLINDPSVLKNFYRGVLSQSGRQKFYENALVAAKLSLLSDKLPVASKPGAMGKLLEEISRTPAYQYSIDWYFEDGGPNMASFSILRDLFHGYLVKFYSFAGVCKNPLPTGRLDPAWTTKLNEIASCWNSQNQPCRTASELAARYGNFICNTR